MKCLLSKLIVWAALLGLGTAFVVFGAEPSQMLWQIGKPDTNDIELALGPADFASFKKDGFYVVGESDPKRDWPYVHPGPTDQWAGSKPHTFTILFGLKVLPRAGECRLLIDLIDTHSSVPPVLQVQVNGHAFEISLPGGAGDEAINGQPAKGRPYQARITFPFGLLQKGNNDIQITTSIGCWMIYDSVGLETPGQAELAAVSSRTVLASVQPVRALRQENGKDTQPILVTVRHSGEPIQAVLRVEGAPEQMVNLHEGERTMRVWVPAVTNETARVVSLELPQVSVILRQAMLRPTLKQTIYVLNHSHLDLGYTDELQKVEAKQIENLRKAIALARETATNAAGSRFIWNIEASWVIEAYLRRASPAERAEFDDAVRNGWLSLEGFYANVLTGLCRPEELLQLSRFSLTEAKRLGVKLDSAMISDIPGFAWGTVEALAQAGIRYLSVGHNRGYTQFDNMSFWWVSQSGRARVLVWTPYGGYDLCSLIQKLDAPFLSLYQDKLSAAKYPYEISYLRWNGHGDNAAPERGATDFAREWNETYTWPKLVVTSTSEAFAAFEKRHGNKIPEVRSEWAPLWEDGAGSSAFETALNRNSAERLEQAQTIFAIRDPNHYPAKEFAEAWNAVLLFSEHTWGSEMSISDPEHQQARAQWESKRSHAVEADCRSKELLSRALGAGTNRGINVYNTCGWTRTGVVNLTPELSAGGDCVLDDHEVPMLSQRLSTGELCFIAFDIPAFGARRYKVVPGQAREGSSSIRITEECLENALVRLRLDLASGGISELRLRGWTNNLIDSSEPGGLNSYIYVPGTMAADAKRNGSARVRIKEKGPLVASLLVEAEAPGCKRLVREIRLFEGADHIELFDSFDKERAPAAPGRKDYYSDTCKESVHLGFPFLVPNGEVYIDEPFAVLRAYQDRMPGTQTNWWTVGRWVEVTSPEFGVTLAVQDTPLVQLGGLTALQDAVAKPRKPQHVYVWAMNNYWHCNYRAYQEGAITFRFALRPHRGRDLAESTRFGQGISQPLLAATALGPTPPGAPMKSSSNHVLVTGCKPTDDGKGWMVRLFNCDGSDGTAQLQWGSVHPVSLWLSGTAEERVGPAKQTVELPPWSTVILRTERE